MRDRFEAALSVWGHQVYRHPWATVAACSVVILVLASQLPNLVMDTSVEGFLYEDDPVRLTYNDFRNAFGRDERLVIAIEAPEIFDLDFLEKLRNLHRDLEAEVPNLQEVSSLINARDTRGEGDDLVVEELLADWPETPKDLAQIRERALSRPLYRNLLLSNDGRVTTVMIQTDAYSSLADEIDALSGFEESQTSGALPRRPFLTGEENSEIVAAVSAVVARYQAPDFEIYVAGSPIMIDRLLKSMLSDMARFTSLAIAAITLLLALLFRRLVGVVVPLVVAVLSLVCTLGMMAYARINISLPVQILPSFLLAVGVGASVHILVIFFQTHRRGGSKEDAVAAALGHSGLAIVMTSVTTAAGLMSFMAAEIAPIAEFGLSGAAGVMISLLLTIVLVPALIAILPMRSHAPTPYRSTRLATRALVGLGDLGTRFAATTVIATVGLLAIAVLGALQLRFSHDPIKWFPEDDSFRFSSEFMDVKLKGTGYVEVLVDSGEENGLHDPELLTRMDRMRQYSASIQRRDLFIGKTISLADVVKETHQALNENRAESYVIPDDRQLVAQELLLFENSGSDDLEELVDSQFRTARFTMKLPMVDAVQYDGFMDEVEAKFSEILGGEASFVVTGLMATMGRTLNAIITSMARSYTIAFLVITPLLIFLIGDLRIGLLSMIPNLTPILITLGLMGWAGFPLDAFTLLIGSIAMGLAVDDTIHFMHNFRRYYARSGDVREAVRETMRTTGQALLFTSLVLSVGFFIYMWASMANLYYFGLLTGFTIITAFLADVVLAPALLTLVLRETAPAGESVPARA